MSISMNLTDSRQELKTLSQSTGSSNDDDQDNWSEATLRDSGSDNDEKPPTSSSSSNNASPRLKPLGVGGHGCVMVDETCPDCVVKQQLNDNRPSAKNAEPGIFCCILNEIAIRRHLDDTNLI